MANAKVEAISSPFLSVILPAYNEAASLPTAIARCSELVSLLGADKVEVDVVDDGSIDDTPTILKQAGLELPWLRVITHPHNMGYGTALRRGFAAASGEFVFYTDADNQFDILELLDLLPFIESADLVAGFRVYRYDPLPRLLASWIYNRMARFVFRLKIRDVDCSFKVMRRERLDRLVLISTDFFIDTELVARARKWNWRVVEVGVRHHPRAAGHTTVRPSDVPRTLRRIATMWRHIYFPDRRLLGDLIAEQDELRRKLRVRDQDLS